MNRDLGVWTYENSALVLIDYQNEMFETIRPETSAELADLNVRLLARAAKAFNMPVVLSTVGVKYGINGRRGDSGRHIGDCAHTASRKQQYWRGQCTKSWASGLYALTTMQ